MTTRIEAYGYWVELSPYSTEGRWDINYSSILTKLIQSAGKYCKYYASDLFIDWQSIDRRLDAGLPIDDTWIFGMRDMGVDSKSFYEARKNGSACSETYHEVWQLTIKTQESDISMILELIEN